MGKKWDYDKWDDISDEEVDVCIVIVKNWLEKFNSFDIS